MTMGERIKQLRITKGFTQEILAEKINVSRSAVAKWEADGGVPEVDNLMQLSFVFGISIDELVGNSTNPSHSKKGGAIKCEVHDFGNQLYDIELTGWNDGVYSVYIITEDQDFLYYYQQSDTSFGVYGMVGKKYITSVIPVKENELKKPQIKEITREFFCGKSVQISLAKRVGILRGLLDFRDDAYCNVVICSFEKDILHLQFGGELRLSDIAKIEEIND